MNKSFQSAFLALIVPLVFSFDRLSKWWALNRLTEGESVALSFFFHLTRVNNTGAAFGFFKDFRIFLIVTSVVCVVVLTLMFWRRRTLHAPIDTASLFIVAGALGNLYDRLRYGYVVDFLDFRVWPVFNLADASITFGVGLVMLQILRKQSLGR